MKKTTGLALVFSCWIFLTAQSVAAPLRIVTLEQPPIQYEEQGVIKGIAVDIVKEVFARMQQPITLKIYPFVRTLHMLKTGQADAIFAIVKKPERELFLSYPHEILIEQTGSLFVRRDSPIQFGGDFRKLSPYTFGILRGATYGPLYDKAVKNGTISKIEDVDDYEKNVLKLINNRVDILVGPRLTMLAAIKELGRKEDVKELSPPIQVVPTYLAFAKQGIAPEIQTKFEQILQELKRDGTYDRIIQAYTH